MASKLNRRLLFFIENLEFNSSFDKVLQKITSILLLQTYLGGR